MGLWLGLCASAIDTLLVGGVVVPILLAVYGRQCLELQTSIRGPLDLVISRVFPAVAVVVFWVYRSATPGKMVFAACLVDARAGAPPRTPCARVVVASSEEDVSPGPAQVRRSSSLPSLGAMRVDDAIFLARRDLEVWCLTCRTKPRPATPKSIAQGAAAFGRETVVRNESDCNSVRVFSSRRVPSASPLAR